MQPPRFGRQAKPRKPWERPPRQPDRRKRGRAGQRERAQVLAEEPLCRKCLERGLEVATDEVDHIVPLSEGGTDTRDNKQGLCKPCHDAKSAAERAAARRSRPDLL
ncbi:HNH endonuclease signature motif containing protein [Sphingomonas sp. GM_Shp_2]|uniref:HNH endonuclease n=1 Tax=Sphingomonas sp. GM_Shp_2 TaxID=2937380 RepID=UPI002269AC6B|nr:HNH endonuclease signature motif containing protein [Sphingomonas sp. GM_Shp_2]